MEDNIQVIITIIIAAFLLFIFPVYMAYEKKDDISYALAMRYTQDLVDEVRSKGYLTKDMYEDYRARLKATGNSYNIELTHEYYRYDPITNYYSVNDDGEYTLVKTSTQAKRQEYEKQVINQAIAEGKLQNKITDNEKSEYITNAYKEQNIQKVVDTYEVSKEIFTTNHILNVLSSEKKLLLNADTKNVVCDDYEKEDITCQYAYIMNVEDNFNVTIKNTNVTLATVLYNMVTANTLDNNTRIYVNYGGAILSSKWTGNIDYSKMKHDNLTIEPFEVLFALNKEKHFTGIKDTSNENNITKLYNGSYIIEFNVNPKATTELRQKGALSVADYSGYNFVLGNKATSNRDNNLAISVGYNGITLITNYLETQVATTNDGIIFPTRQVCTDKVETITDSATGNTITSTTTTCEEVRTKITDYASLNVSYVSKADTTTTLLVKLTGKNGIQNYEGYIEVKDEYNLLSGINYSINNPEEGSVEYTLGTANNPRGTKVKCSINISSTTIQVTATKNLSRETTILSYPTTIDGYVNVKIEMNKNESGKYVAVLYLDGERKAESIELSVTDENVPRIDYIGGTNIGSETRYFIGYIKDLIIYN